MRFLKSNLTVVGSVLLYIVNLSISTRTVPSSWKSATLTPLYKEGDKTDPANYRPISILPVISKILERVVHKQLYKYLSDNRILSDAQFGFRKGYSTSSCVISLVATIFNNMSQGLLTGVLFLDLKKAFDTVDHSILLRKLHMYGMGPGAVDWFEHYLTNRVQCTKINNKLSDFQAITCGVPQGSILGPLMFILYINDMESVITDCKLSLYADDTALYFSNTSFVELMMTLRDEIHSVSQWQNLNKLTLNTKKNEIHGLRKQNSSSYM